ncbi:MAG: hypothetical protein COB60_12770, partial [Flavobacteriaceae bacterium]
NVYQCQDKKWIALGALELKFWNLFCEVIHKTSWKTENSDDLIVGTFDKQKLEELFRRKPRDSWVKLFKNFDVCLSPVLELEELKNGNNDSSYGAPFDCFEG